MSGQLLVIRVERRYLEAARAGLLAGREFRESGFKDPGVEPARYLDDDDEGVWEIWLSLFDLGGRHDGPIAITPY